ncbi:hypothetical protein [Leisingera sp. F5]|uniref:hypothetical protein n=1 Tax=Leisingera sp. F5 TaxID=1813816 RepID=UPI000B1C90E1|nr:hypothetical protein [Leisingera sp. F5]
MKVRFIVVLFSAMLFSASPSQADDFGLDDVKGWLDGCVALAPTTAPMSSVLELDCLKAAIKYCEVGRSKEYHETCRRSLASRLSSEVVMIRPFLEPAAEMKVRSRRSYERRLERLDNSNHETCPEDLQETECELVQVGLNWLEARSLARVIDISFQQVIDEGKAEN